MMRWLLPIDLHMHDRSKALRIINGLHNGRNVTINPQHCSDISYNGGSIWKTISNTLKNPIVKAVAPILINAGVSAAGGSPESGAMAGNISSALLNANAKSGSGILNHIPGRIVNSKITKNGSGFFQTVGKVASSKVTKGIAKAIAPVIAQSVKDKTGSNLAGNLTNASLNAYAGSGFFQTVDKVASSKVTKGIAKAIAPVIAQSVKDKTGSNLAGNLTTAGINAYAGSGMRRRMKNDDCEFHGGSVENTVGLGGNRPANVFNNAHERMAWVRSHRKKAEVLRQLVAELNHIYFISSLYYNI